MAIESARPVVGLFPSRARADAAVQRLHQLGVPDMDMETGAPEPGCYHLEYDESGELGRGVVFGIGLGVPIGSIVAMWLLIVAVPSLSVTGIVGLGILIGGFWGIFFGGLGGMVVKVLDHAAGGPAYTVSERSTDVVVIVHADSQVGAARRALLDQGVRYFLTDVPVMRGPQLVLSAAH